jgi:hypothetical protein
MGQRFAIAAGAALFLCLLTSGRAGAQPLILAAAGALALRRPLAR